jgi:hypothetical protein
MLSLFKRIESLMRDGVIDTEVGTVYELDQIAQAAREAEKPARGGRLSCGSRHAEAMEPSPPRKAWWSVV